MELYETVSLQCAYYAIRTPIIIYIVPTPDFILLCNVKYATDYRCRNGSSSAIVSAHNMKSREKYIQRLCVCVCDSCVFIFLFYFFFVARFSVTIDVGPSDGYRLFK